jgi:hypothetical protein
MHVQNSIRKRREQAGDDNEASLPLALAI